MEGEGEEKVREGLFMVCIANMCGCGYGCGMTVEHGWLFVVFECAWKKEQQCMED